MVSTPCSKQCSTQYHGPRAVHGEKQLLQGWSRQACGASNISYHRVTCTEVWTAIILSSGAQGTTDMRALIQHDCEEQQTKAHCFRLCLALSVLLWHRAHLRPLLPCTLAGWLFFRCLFSHGSSDSLRVPARRSAFECTEYEEEPGLEKLGHHIRLATLQQQNPGRVVSKPRHLEREASSDVCYKSNGNVSGGQEPAITPAIFSITPESLRKP